uniref:Uncharacterized protein n=1 Tax=Rhodopseudomonas palustris (strain ATCC BAA-98 / CGA009) TaxID=258594 RepID=Q6N7I4_RHOPA|nr:hypothetical protein RPA2273 [Rhodopseudomonas palustris CGA009]
MARKPNKQSADYDDSVFVNCSFDSQYKPVFNAIVFTIILCGFRARCALEIDDGSQPRIEKIFSIIERCRFEFTIFPVPRSMTTPNSRGSTCRSNSACS